MVFIIKSTNGTRTASIVKNEKKVDIEPILEVLKGLTIKIELKVADLFLSDDKTSVEIKLEQQHVSQPAPVYQEPKESKQVQESGSQHAQQLTSSRDLSSREPSDELKRLHALKTKLPPQEPKQLPPQDPKQLPPQEPKQLPPQEPKQLPPQEPKQLTTQEPKQVPTQQPKQLLAQEPRQLPPPMASTQPKELFVPRQVTVSKASVLQETKEVVQTNIAESIESEELKQLSKQYLSATGGYGDINQKEDLLGLCRKKLGKPKLNKGQLAIGHTYQLYAIAISQSKSENSKPTIAYVPYDTSKVQDLVAAIVEIEHEIESQPTMTNISTDDIVFAKSADDDQWYRAIVEEVDSVTNQAKVFYFDWGLHETLDTSRLRHLMSLGLSSYPAVAIKVEPKQSEYTDDFMLMTNTYSMRVDSYNDFTETYTISLLGCLDS